MPHPPNPIVQRVKDSAKQLLPDALFLSLLHLKHIGRFPKLLRPTTFNEKILQRSLRPDPGYSVLTDKLAVREYVKKIGEKHLVPLITAPQVFTRAVFEQLPESFVTKTNHGSSFVELVHDKSQLTFEHLNFLASQWMSTNFYKIARERHYSEIRPRIFFENLLLDDGGCVPADYKVHCFANRPGPPMMYIAVISDRFGEVPRGDVFDVQWNHLDVTIGPYVRSTATPPPANLDSIPSTATVLSEDFDYVRVDLYAPNNDIYFGELTFTPGVGIVPMRPDRVDFEWGRLLT
ncbi:MAG: Glycosyltransferase (EC [uncultured Paraburkholderia sp.]|nr:MAG: Glycosyltransferase (EC [uncultured Paraburkholderia sp.]CAH2945605.1 MAG: Glycosyltransferase (EC [uncultured Paraburkholderia sp.]